MPKPNKESKGEANTTEAWRQGTDMSEVNQYQYMLENDILTDCTFVVGRDGSKSRKFRAHRVHVARVSPVFQAMLQYGEMREAKTGNIRIKDISPRTFHLLLNYIYEQESETCYQESQDLAFAADKYQMKNLLEDCVTRMNVLIEPENVWAAFRTADLLRQEIIKKTCIQVLQRDTLRCIIKPGFMQTSEENVALLLEQDELNVDDEQLLVNTIVHWARHAARQRGLPGDDSGVRAVLEPRLLSLLRFLAMSHQQFMLGPGLSGWLTDDEKSTIAECLQSGDFSKLPQHLSSIAQKRKIVSPFMELACEDGDKLSRRFICKRKIIGFRSDVKQTNHYCCRFSETKLEYTPCFHAMLIFRVKSNCKWLGFQCASRHKVPNSDDPTALKRSTDEKTVYMENIVATTYKFQHSLSIDYHIFSFGGETFYQRETEYNSSITILFDDPL